MLHAMYGCGCMECSIGLSSCYVLVMLMDVLSLVVVVCYMLSCLDEWMLLPCRIIYFNSFFVCLLFVTVPVV